jgi:hypothetical protein
VNKLINGLLVLLIVAVGVLLYRKFSGSDDRDVFRIQDTAALTVLSLDEAGGQQIPFADLVVGDSAFVFFLEIANCDTCVVKGMNDIAKLQAAGEQAFVVIVDDDDMSVSSWAVHHPKTQIYRMPTTTFNRKVHAVHLPALVTFKKGAVDKARLVTL